MEDKVNLVGGEEGREGMGVGALSKLELTFVATAIYFPAVQQS